MQLVEFELNGQKFSALNGGPAYTFNEAVSVVVPCQDQAEVDYYWDRLSDGGQRDRLRLAAATSTGCAGRSSRRRSSTWCATRTRTR